MNNSYIITNYNYANGAYGQVSKAINLTNNKPVAIKRIRLDYIEELNINLQIKDKINRSFEKYICLLLDYIIEDHIYYDLVFNFYSYTLHDIIYNKYNKHLHNNTISIIINNIVSGLYFLNSINIIHTDITPRNILISYNFIEHKYPIYIDYVNLQVKIADFSCSVMSNKLINYPLTTIPYRAPEICKYIENNDMYRVTTKIDIWSLGCIIYEMIHLTTLFKRFTNDQLLIDIDTYMHMRHGNDILYCNLLQYEYNRIDIQTLYDNFCFN
ncbi:protein kinase [Alphaentomopoxvirus acuprea]|uniref:Protein kinase n=1 Tax=Alphaentomopoxvirus acuprea TaxID=62099 RepID=W6JIK0_9POXV|nr:protein kinase [Anomala cuprea entomopoxvirus]BAO49388.1 protein kinase [Anomala cuprea entomopoxvirus]